MVKKKITLLTYSPVSYTPLSPHPDLSAEIRYIVFVAASYRSQFTVQNILTGHELYSHLCSITPLELVLKN